MSAEAPPLRSGGVLLHYRLNEKLGQGGMGEVWAATDSTLDRRVAIKALPPALSTDPERLARFEREAKLLASLNHPNIATVHSVHVVAGRRYLIMELVPGEDLSLRIARGPTPLHETLDIVRQVALALGAAHDQGVIHRDLKPANVRITPDGQVKVLDFGLAKALEPAGEAMAPGLSQSPTFLGSMTPGVILGTAGYMAPEQARGQAADRRSDLWALGVILHELLAGTRAFEGETISDTLAAVLRSEPDSTRLPKDLPPAIGLLLERLLQKDPRRRLRDVGAVLLLVEEVLAGGGRLAGASPAAAEPDDAGRPVRGLLRRALPWIGAAAGLLLAAIAGWTLRPAPPEPPVRKFTLALGGLEGAPASPSLSPDGRWLAILAKDRLWVRDLRQGASRLLAENVDPDIRPAWSPDSRVVVVAIGSQLSRVTVESGAVQPVCTVQSITGGAGVAWLDDHTLVFTRGTDHLYRVAAAGGVADILVPRIDSTEVDLHHPFVLPGGRGILVVRHGIGGPPSTLCVLKDGQRHDLLSIPAAYFWQPVHDPRGYLLFGRVGGDGAGLWAVRFSLDRLKIEGEPFLVTARGAEPSRSADGLLAYLDMSHSDSHPVIVVDRGGTVVDTLAEARTDLRSLELSRDGKRLVVETRIGNLGGLWLDDLERKATSRFAFDDTERFAEAAWSPDGRTLAYTNVTRGEILLRPADGSQAPRRVTRGSSPRFTADGRHLMFDREQPGGKRDLWLVDVDSPGDSTVLLATPANETMARPAPRGGYYAYLSDEGRNQEVYLAPYPRGSGRWQVSTNGADRFVWSPRGDRIYYFDSDHIYEVEVELEPSVRLGTPRLLFDTSRLNVQNWGRHWMAPTLDADRFLFFGRAISGGRDTPQVEIVENWSAEFERR